MLHDSTLFYMEMVNKLQNKKILPSKRILTGLTRFSNSLIPLEIMQGMSF